MSEQGFKIVDYPQAQENGENPNGMIQNRRVELIAPQKPKESLFQSLMNKGKKYYYSFIASYSKAESFKLRTAEDSIVVTGIEFKKGLFPETNEQAEKRMKSYLENMVWFSYRVKFPIYIENTKLDNDIGWGCMIRCGQMLFCQAILRSRQIQSDKEKTKIIALFKDSEKNEVAPFSIHNLTQYAHKEFSVSPGQWFRATTIMMSLEALNNKYSPSVSYKIKVISALDSLVLINDFYSQVFGHRESDQSEDSSHLLHLLKTQKWPTEVLFCVASRIGLSKPQDNFKEAMKKLISLPQSLGILGGKESKAYYIVGIILLTEDTTSGKDADGPDDVDLEKCKPKALYEYNYEDMVTSLMPAFYIRDEKDFSTFYDSIQGLVKSCGEDNMPLNFSLDSGLHDEMVEEF